MVDDKETVIKQCEMGWDRNINKEERAGSGENGVAWGWADGSVPVREVMMEVSHRETCSV